MKEIFTEEEYNDAVKKYNEQMKIDFFGHIQNYPSYEGYADLRNYQLSEDLFGLLWRCQDFLFAFDHLDRTKHNNASKFYSEIKDIYVTYLNKI